MLRKVISDARRNGVYNHLSLQAQFYSTKHQYRAVIFDMAGVVLPSPFPMTIEYEALRKIPAGTIWEAIRIYGKKGAWPKLEIGELDDQEFGVVFSEECSKIAQQDIDVKDFLGYLEEGMANPIKEVLEAVSCLKQEGFKTALLTNNWKKSDGSTLLPFDTSDFDVIIESAVEGLHKPLMPIYNLCLNRLGVAANEAIFLDDMNPNLQMAKSMGILSIKVEDVFVAINELEERLEVQLTPEKRGTVPVAKHMQIDMNNLTAYLNSQLEMKLSCKPDIYQFSHGQSNPTYLIDCGASTPNMVLRKKPPGKLLPSAHAVEREYRIMEVLSKHGVKTPGLISLCEDDSVIGTPFYLAKQVQGNIYKDPSLPGMSRETRSKIYDEMIDTLCSIHRVDINKAGIEDYGKQGNFISRQTRTWTRQYRASETHEIKHMELLLEWLPKHMVNNPELTVVHGDYRLDNLIYTPNTQQVASVLDWELSTLGDPLSDLAYCCIPYYLPRNFPLLPGLKGINLNELGIPTPEQLVKRYCKQMNVAEVENFNFYMAFTFFKVAAIMQGVYKRSLHGQASSSRASVAKKITEQMAEMGWTFASKEGFRLFNTAAAIESGASGVSAATAREVNSAVSWQKREYSTSTKGRNLTFEKTT